MEKPRIVRCPSCSSQFQEQYILDLDSCPSCNSRASPEYLDEDVTITINWSSLRLLANWASSWASSEFPKDHLANKELSLVLDKIRNYKPEHSEPLTLEDVLADLIKAGKDPSKLNSLTEDASDAIEQGTLFSNDIAKSGYIN